MDDRLHTRGTQTGSCSGVITTVTGVVMGCLEKGTKVERDGD